MNSVKCLSSSRQLHDVVQLRQFSSLYLHEYMFVLINLEPKDLHSEEALVNSDASTFPTDCWFAVENVQRVECVCFFAMTVVAARIGRRRGDGHVGQGSLGEVWDAAWTMSRLLNACCLRHDHPFHKPIYSPGQTVEEGQGGPASACLANYAPIGACGTLQLPVYCGRMRGGFSSKLLPELWSCIYHSFPKFQDSYELLVTGEGTFLIGYRNYEVHLLAVDPCTTGPVPSRWGIEQGENMTQREVRSFRFGVLRQGKILERPHCIVKCDADQALKTERLWKELISDPSQWWDNRLAKVQYLHPW